MMILSTTRSTDLPLLYPSFLTDGAASLFRWSADGKYLARKGKDLISIYELPSMRLLDKKSLKVWYLRYSTGLPYCPRFARRHAVTQWITP